MTPTVKTGSRDEKEPLENVSVDHFIERRPKKFIDSCKFILANVSDQR